MFEELPEPDAIVHPRRRPAKTGIRGLLAAIAVLLLVVAAMVGVLAIGGAMWIADIENRMVKQPPKAPTLDQRKKAVEAAVSQVGKQDQDERARDQDLRDKRAREFVKDSDAASKLEDYRAKLLARIKGNVVAVRLGKMNAPIRKLCADAARRIDDQGIENATDADILAATKIYPATVLRLLFLAGFDVEEDKLALWREYRSLNYLLHPEDRNDPVCEAFLSDASLERDFREWADRSRR
jgi:hypothetical protein